MNNNLTCTACGYSLTLDGKPAINCPQCGDAKFSIILSENNKASRRVRYL